MQARGRSFRRAFTVTELLVVVAIIVTLAALLFPGGAALRARAKQTQCVNHLRQWGVAIHQHAQDNDGSVYWNNWASISQANRYYDKYLGNSTVMMDAHQVLPTQYYRRCPAQAWDGKGNGPAGYAFARPDPKQSGAGTFNLRSAARLSQLLLMVDASALVINGRTEFENVVKPICEGPDRSQIRHGGRVNALFGDGHVAMVSWRDLDGSPATEDAELVSWFSLY
jgi:prepilin-type processing-associated H-X9-DG protein/prepilin-type N-terminal cleavage/methylation domain-containing protein